MSNWTQATKRLVKVGNHWIDPVAVEALTRSFEDTTVRLASGHTLKVLSMTPDAVAEQLFMDTSREDQS